MQKFLRTLLCAFIFTRLILLPGGKHLRFATMAKPNVGSLRVSEMQKFLRTLLCAFIFTRLILLPGGKHLRFAAMAKPNVGSPRVSEMQKFLRTLLCAFIFTRLILLPRREASPLCCDGKAERGFAPSLRDAKIPPHTTVCGGILVLPAGIEPTTAPEEFCEVVKVSFLMLKTLKNVHFVHYFASILSVFIQNFKFFSCFATTFI